jgi:hypothetical protein
MVTEAALVGSSAVRDNRHRRGGQLVSVSHGLDHDPLDVTVDAWPAIAMVGSSSS